MNDRLRNALNALRSLDSSLAPVPFADARESALVEGLHGLAAEYGREISFTRIDANGEMDFNISGPHRGYGDGLAAVLSTIPRRTGTTPTRAAVLPENSWCRINHFDAERLLIVIAAEADADKPRK